MIDELDGVAVHDVLNTEQRGVVIDFWAPWCAPCRVLRPHLNKLAQERETGWRFVAVNTEAHPEAAKQFGVSALPTLVVFRQGAELHRFTGATLPSAMDEKLEELSQPSE
jgi:thioredoxin